MIKVYKYMYNKYDVDTSSLLARDQVSHTRGHPYNLTKTAYRYKADIRFSLTPDNKLSLNDITSDDNQYQLTGFLPKHLQLKRVCKSNLIVFNWLPGHRHSDHHVINPHYPD